MLIIETVLQAWIVMDVPDTAAFIAGLYFETDKLAVLSAGSEALGVQGTRQEYQQGLYCWGIHQCSYFQI
jgi:hypothetical protein